jgi:hypothetical protein
VFSFSTALAGRFHDQRRGRRNAELRERDDVATA